MLAMVGLRGWEGRDECQITGDSGMGGFTKSFHLSEDVYLYHVPLISNAGH